MKAGLAHAESLGKPIETRRVEDWSQIEHALQKGMSASRAQRDANTFQKQP
jgi:hypothetical protein